MSGWYPWHYDDYERDAGHLDHVSDSCYRRLIDFYMRTREPIPRDPVRLMFITRTSPDQFATVWPRLQPFFDEQNGHLHLKRCNIELDRQDRQLRQQTEAGRRSAEKRRQQYQLLINGRSTTVQRPFNDRSTDDGLIGEERRGEDKTESIINTVPNPERLEAPSRKREAAIPLPANWKPDEIDIQAATGLGLVNGSIDSEAVKFKNYYLHGRGQGTRTTTRAWRTRWVNWCDKAINMRGGLRQPAPAPRARTIEEIDAALAADAQKEKSYDAK